MVTSTTIPDSDAYNWIIAPAGRCVLAVGDGAAIGGLVHRAMAALANQGPLLAVAEQAMRAAGADTADIQHLRAQQPELAARAKELLDADLHPLHTGGVVSLWASLEVAVEDTAVVILLRDPSAMPVLAASGVRLPANLSDPLTEADARRVFVRFDRLSSESRRVTEAYVHVLETLGVALGIDAVTHNTLTELNYVRNCVLHRGGIVDERVAIEAPSLNFAPGQLIRIGQAMYLAYFDAVKEFALALMDAVLKSKHAGIKSTTF